MLGSETAETNLRTLLQPCYLQLLGVAVGERDCGDESADAAVTMLFATVGRRCWTCCAIPLLRMMLVEVAVRHPAADALGRRVLLLRD